MTSVDRIAIEVLPPAAMSPDYGCYIAIDALRATTTMVAALQAGATSVTVVAEERLAREMAAREGALLSGEIRSLRPPGFDLGNSPTEMAGAPIQGRAIVQFTTNGTRLICSLPWPGRVFAGALTNARAVAQVASARGSVALVCAGNEGGQEFSLEDYAVAARIARHLQQSNPNASLNDGAKLGLALLGSHADLADRRAGELMRMSDHAARLREVSLDVDIDAACQANSSQVVPVVYEIGAGYARLQAMQERQER